MYVCEPSMCLYMCSYELLCICICVCVNLWCGCGYKVEQTAQISGYELRGPSSQHGLTQALWARYSLRPSVSHLDLVENMDS